MNRIASDILVFPYTFEDIQIKQNDFSTSDNFSSALEKLNANLLYLINQSTLSGYTVVYDTDFYPLSSITVKDDEFISSMVVNKYLTKILYNTLNLRDNLHSTFVIVNNEFVKTRYITDNDPNIYFITLPNNTVGINEVHSTSVINRALKEVYILQTNLLTLIQGVSA